MTKKLGHITRALLATFALVLGSTSAFAQAPLSAAGPTTSTQLRSVITDETGTGALVFGTSPTLTTPRIGATTLTGVGAYTATLTFTGTTGVTFPTSGILATAASASMTPGNVAITTAAGVDDSGVQLLTSMTGRRVWGNNSATSGPPGELAVLTLGDGTAAAPVYSFGASTGTGMFSPQANYVALTAGGNKGFQVRSTDATSFLEYIYSGQVILRAQGGTNASATFAANGTGEVSLQANGASTNGIIARFTPSGTAGSAQNYFRFTTGQAGANPVFTTIASGTGDTAIGFDFTPTGTGTVRNTSTFFHSRSGVSIGAGSITQAAICASSTAGFCWYYGTGDPTHTAAKGSLYTKTDATTTTTRLWVNTDGGTTWAAFTSGS